MNFCDLCECVSCRGMVTSKTKFPLVEVRFGQSTTIVSPWVSCRIFCFTPSNKTRIRGVTSSVFMMICHLTDVRAVISPGWGWILMTEAGLDLCERGICLRSRDKAFTFGVLRTPAHISRFASSKSDGGEVMSSSERVTRSAISDECPRKERAGTGGAGWRGC